MFRFILIFCSLMNAVASQACTWVPYENKRMYGGVVNSAAYSLTDCQASCTGNSGCLAIEWDFNMPAGSQCYTFKTSNEPTFSANGVTHYICSGLTNCNWNNFYNLRMNGGILQSSASTLDSCRSICINIAGCQAVEFVAAYQQCFTFTQSDYPNIQANGIIHSICTGCSWTTYTNLQLYGGLAQPTVTSLPACQNLCASTPGCQAIEWVPNNGVGSQCFTFTSSAVPTISASGINHYICSG
ncbi:hypothetical protein HELRODRAFT_176881 [Helobdella robusta]|uniref:Apple domain-containing protein n=1 Tax=Helobdella robusta TaxID=6412 RepID=T1FB02_HELRO|nr:hypothetical protein HELRODRAFT_176881 [Helobdella robusta]ESN98413.1 hypothetical protein HELRODRAFT_176881 [Helobdella robusta]